MIPKPSMTMPSAPEEPACIIVSPFSNELLLEDRDHEGIKAAKERLKKYEYKNIDLTSIAEIIKKNERFSDMVKADFFSHSSGPKKDESEGTTKFIDYINGKFEPMCEGKFYSSCLQGLLKSYCREILLKILSESTDILDASSKD